MMACGACENVWITSPPQTQASRFYICPTCGQVWWCTEKVGVGYWTRIDGEESVRAAILGRPMIRGLPGGESISVDVFNRMSKSKMEEARRGTQ